MTSIYAGLALLAGACLAVQVGVNGELRARLGGSLPSALSSFVLLFAAAQLNPARTSAAHPFEPPGLIRPPKSMA